MAGLKIVFAVILMVPWISASNMCSFHYNVPKTGGSCQALGGVDQDLEDKVNGLTGSFEGLKAIREANTALTKELQTSVGYARQTQHTASQQLDSLATDIQSLKYLLNVLHDEPDTSGDVDLRSNRAVPADPNRLLRLALQDAEMKIRNMTSFMVESARRQSITRTSMEMRIQQQKQRLQRAMTKLHSLEQEVVVLGGHPRVASPYFNTVEQDFVDLVNASITTSAAVAARALVATARNDDITVKIANVLLPLTAADRQLNQIHSDTLTLTLRVDAYENDTADLDYEIKSLNTKWSANLLQILTKIPIYQQNLKSFEQQVANFTRNVTGVSNTLSQEEADINSIKNQLDTLAQSVQASLLSINQTQAKVENFEKNPFVTLAEVENNAIAEIQRETNVIKQLQQAIKGLKTIVATLPTPTPATGNHPRRRSMTPWQRSVLCDA